MRRRLSDPRTGEVRFEDLGPAAAVAKGVGGSIVQGMSADEVRVLVERISRTERRRKEAAA